VTDRRGSDAVDAPDPARDHYRSVDSAPADYSLDRPAQVVNSFLVSFVAVSLLVLLLITLLVRDGLVGRSRDIVFLATSGDQASIPVRLFLLIFFAVFSVHLATNVRRRALVMLELCGGLLVGSLAVDLLAWRIERLSALDVPVVTQQVAAALAALALFPVVILRNAHLPEPVGSRATGTIARSAWVRFAVPLAVAVSVTGVVAQQLRPLVDGMRDLAVLGGVGPGVFLVQQLFVLVAGAVGMVLVRRSRRVPFTPPLAVVVPAHNEAHGIGRTITALDRAAAAYDAPVRLYVVDNVSTDDTAAVAQTALERCEHLRGRLLSCPTPGKANALNHGFEQVGEPFVVRVDADTEIAEHCLTVAMRHFANDRVGAVGGLPLPAHHESFIGRARLVEVLVRHGFFQVARMGYDGLIGLPGMFTAFRRSALAQAGAIARGMNGEDTDICLRLNSLGYRCLVEPRAEYRTEILHSWAHLREQRIRWFRSTYHVAGHNRRVLLHGSSMAGAVALPISLLNSARRAMLVPVTLFALLLLGVFSPTFLGLRWQPVVAMGIGVPATVAIVVSLLLRRPRAILYVPEYLAFRFLRGYFTLAALLSLRFRPLESRRRRRPTVS
jgi:cellulose synthase/poly-beta-1,6-N-acetylglucosamine synthase-like glycosyltransferase